MDQQTSAKRRLWQPRLLINQNIGILTHPLYPFICERMYITGWFNAESVDCQKAFKLPSWSTKHLQFLRGAPIGCFYVSRLLCIELIVSKGVNNLQIFCGSVYSCSFQNQAFCSIIHPITIMCRNRYVQRAIIISFVVSVGHLNGNIINYMPKFYDSMIYCSKIVCTLRPATCQYIGTQMIKRAVYQLQIYSQRNVSVTWKPNPYTPLKTIQCSIDSYKNRLGPLGTRRNIMRFSVEYMNHQESHRGAKRQ